MKNSFLMSRLTSQPGVLAGDDAAERRGRDREPARRLTDEEFAALKERVKEQGAVVKASKEARTASCRPR